MAFQVKTATDALGGGQNHCGAEALSPCGESAAGTTQVWHRQRQACLSVAAPRTRHCPVAGRHQHRRPARPVPRWVRSVAAAPIAPSADLRASLDLASDPGLRSSTAITWWLSTTALAQLRALVGCLSTRTSSPPLANQPWRSSNAMSRTSPTHVPRPLPVEVRGSSGSAR
jgi:hypothetical protein